MYHTLDKLQRAGLDPTLPHFQLDFDKFSFLDYEQAASLRMSEILNELHLFQIKKEKNRLAKSMIDEKINTYMDDNSESEYDYGHDVEEK